MSKKLKERNLKILTRHHELTLTTKKLEKEKNIEIAQEMGITAVTVKRVIDKYYNKFKNEIGMKNTCLQGLTNLREALKYENYTAMQIEYIVQKLFGASDTKAAKKAGYKSKSSITNLRRNLGIQTLIDEEREKVLKDSKYGFTFLINSLGKIVDNTQNSVQERSITDKQGGKNGAELSKTINEKVLYGIGVQASAQISKMLGFDYADRIRAGKLEVDIERLSLDSKRLEVEKEEKILKANIEVLNLEILTGNTDIEEEVQGVQESLKTWTEEAWKDEKNN